MSGCLHFLGGRFLHALGLSLVMDTTRPKNSDKDEIPCDGIYGIFFEEGKLPGITEDDFADCVEKIEKKEQRLAALPVNKKP